MSLVVESLQISKKLKKKTWPISQRYQMIRINIRAQLRDCQQDSIKSH